MVFKPNFSKQFIYNAWLLRNKFNTSNECLIHGDLHNGSIMLNQKECYIIDSEFAFIGPIGFDLGLLFANFITMLITKPSNNNYQQNLKTSISEIWYNFKTTFCKLWTKNLQADDKRLLSHYLETVQTNYLNEILNDALGFAGMEICQRIAGIAGVKEIRAIENSDQRMQLEMTALSMVKN